MMNAQQGWKTKLFADTADLARRYRLAADPNIRGFTTNPTLMRRAGVSDYEGFAREAVAHIPDRPVSFEDSPTSSKRWSGRPYVSAAGACVYVKVPITNTRGASSLPKCCARLAARGRDSHERDGHDDAAAVGGRGRGASRKRRVRSFRSSREGSLIPGVDPIPVMVAALGHAGRRIQNRADLGRARRELLNIFQANAVGCDIITATPDVLAKLPLLGKDLTSISLETVRMFQTDARHRRLPAGSLKGSRPILKQQLQAELNLS